VKCAQRTRAELAQKGSRHPVVSRFQFPLANPLPTIVFLNGDDGPCPIAAFQPSRAGLQLDAGYPGDGDAALPAGHTSLIATMSWLPP
jgi:hypothetical protein